MGTVANNDALESHRLKANGPKGIKQEPRVFRLAFRDCLKRVQADRMPNRLKLPHLLLIAYVVVFIALGIKPYARDVWFTENMAIVPIVVILVVLYRRGIQLSNLSYIMMSFLVFIHTVGGHYTFERVPFDLVNKFFGFERNNYDRFGHFSVGFYAFPIMELLDRYDVIRKRWVAYLFALFSIMSVAMAYELFEWVYAVLSDPKAGIAVLGSQGDIWDAQKDMLCDTLGAVCALGIYCGVSRSRLKTAVRQ
jgi:putative membrane protein